MTRGIRGRIVRLEEIRDGLPGGCVQCRHWHYSVHEYEDGVEDPPAFCASCGRARPAEHFRMVYGLPADWDAPEAAR